MIPAVRLYMGHTVMGILSKVTEIGGNTVNSVFQYKLNKNQLIIYSKSVIN